MTAKGFWPPAVSARRSAYARSATAIGLAIQADEEAGYVLREIFHRNFGVWREREAGRDVEFDSLFPKGTPLRVVGALARVGPTAWTGPSRGPGGGGTLTLTGRVDLARRACCETPRADGARHTHALRFRWTTPGGELGGCLVNMVLRRPHGRYVWDAPGRVTIATGRLARYRGRSIALAGVTAAVRTNRTRIILSAEGRPPAGC